MKDNSSKEDLRLRVWLEVGQKYSAGIEAYKDREPLSYDEFVEEIGEMNERDRHVIEVAKLAMDEYFERRVKEDLFPWMAKHKVDCDPHEKAKEEDKCFWYKGEWITAKELFENFL